MSTDACKKCGRRGLEYPVIRTEGELEVHDPHVPGYVLVDAVVLRAVWRLVADRGRRDARGRQSRLLELLLVGLEEKEGGMVEDALAGLMAEYVLGAHRAERRRRLS